VEDILSATKKLRVLGTAFSVIPLTSGRYLVQSVPGELSQDQVHFQNIFKVLPASCSHPVITDGTGTEL
jgi:hypothetical protein